MPCPGRPAGITIVILSAIARIVDQNFMLCKCVKIFL